MRLRFPLMLVTGVSILLAAFVVPAPWGLVLVGCVLAWEIAEKAFLVRYTKRIPVAVGREALIGRQVTVLSACRPRGRVQLLGERWAARCAAGAGVGDTLVIEAVEQITLVVGKPHAGRNSPLLAERPGSRRLL
jgi:membrane protein implicated in regulation of membrane protease activity